MADFYPAAQQIQNPDILKSFIQGQMAPLQVQQAQQQLTAGNLNIQQLQLALKGQQMTQSLAQQLYGQSAGAQNSGGQSGGIQNGPQGAVSSQTPQSSQTDPSSGYSAPGGSDPRVNTMMALDVLAGRDPLKTAQGAQEYEQKQRQLQASGPLATLDTIAGSASPARIVMNNPGLMQRWQQMAPQLGLDPVKDFSDDNVRSVINFARNNIAGQAGLPTKEPAVKQQDIPGPLGSLYQRDPITNKVTQVRGEEPLKDVIGDNGLPTNARASVAEGKQPFNSSIFGAANVSDQALQFAADTYRTTGKFPGSFGRNPAMQAKVLDKVAADAQASGDTTGAITARAASLKANGMALDQTTKLESATTSFAGTLDKNLDSLLASAKQVDSTGSPLVNKALRAYQQGITGDKDVAQMVTWLNAVEGEYAKINSGSLGNAPTSDAAKKDAKEVINKNFSAGGMEAVAQAIRQETQNRLSSIREQKQSLVGSLSQGAPGTQGSTPPAASSSSAAPPMKNAQGWVLHTDAKGNKAYVSPDGKQFQEVK